MTDHSSRIACAFAVFVALLVCATPARAQDGIRCPGEPAAMAITYGDVVDCEINTGTDTDDFTFSGVTGESIVVNINLGCITLTAPGGAVTDACSDSHNRLDSILTETGTYRITVRRSPPMIGGHAYGIALERLNPASPAARPIAVGETVADQFNIAGDLDLFSFTGAVNHTVAVVMDSPGRVALPCVELIAPDNSRAVACPTLFTNRLQATLTQDGTYVIVVRQISSLPGPYSIQFLCVSGSCAAPPGPPIGLTGAVSTYATSLSWTAPASGGPPTSYVVEAGTTSGATNVVAYDMLSTATTFMAPGIPNGTYFVRIRARNAAGTSAPSNEITITGGSGGCAPGPPGTLSVTVAGPNVTFQWGAAAGGPTSYVLEAGTSPGSSNLVAFDVGLTTQFAVTAPPGVYYVRVRARNACGSSAPSNEVTVPAGQGCTPPGAPPNFTVSLAGRVMTLAWGAATGQPTSYILEAGAAPGQGLPPARATS
jgi:hypothetical protein